LFWLTFEYAIFKIVNQKSDIVNQIALGIEAQILLLPFRNKRLQRKARPTGERP